MNLRAFDLTVVTSAALVEAGQLGDRVKPTALNRHISRGLIRNALGNMHGLLRAGAALPRLIISMHIAMSPSAIAAESIFGIPFIQYVHAKELRLRPRLARLALRRARRIVAVSDFSRKLAIDAGAEPGRVSVVHPGVDLPDGPFGPKTRFPSMLTVARLDDPHKGHDLILRALPCIIDAVPTVQWVCIGGGRRLPQLVALARQLGVEAHVQFLGPVSDVERNGWLTRSHVFVMPVRDTAAGAEGFGIAYMEASAHATAVIGSTAGGASSAILHGVSGLLIPPDNVEALAQASIDVLSDLQLRDALALGGRLWAEQHAWAAVADDLTTIASRILSRPR